MARQISSYEIPTVRGRPVWASLPFTSSTPSSEKEQRITSCICALRHSENSSSPSDFALLAARQMAGASWSGLVRRSRPHARSSPRHACWRSPLRSIKRLLLSCAVFWRRSRGRLFALLALHLESDGFGGALENLDILDSPESGERCRDQPAVRRKNRNSSLPSDEVGAL